MDIQVTPLLKDSIILLGAKRNMLRKEASRISSLVMGSSHGDYGFDPQYCPGGFNLCSRSQDLKHSFHLYQRLHGELPNLRHLVLYYSVFSPGSVMERIPNDKEACPAINELFDLGIYYSDPYLAELSANISGHLDNLNINLDGYWGFMPTVAKTFFPAAYGAQRRAADHMKYNARSDAAPYLGRILELAQQRRHKVFIVVPPAREDYRQACQASFAEIFRDLLATLDAHRGADAATAPQLINCFADPACTASDFGDFDHLLPNGNGTRYLSSAIAAAIALADSAQP